MKLLYSFFLLTYILISPSIFHSFYDFYGDIPLKYEVKFVGDIILTSDLFTYTNTNTYFTFDYSIVTRSQYTDEKNVLIDWFFSPIRDSNLPSIFHELWNLAIEYSKKNLVYSVLANSNQFLVFDKQGKKNILSYFFEQFFPILNTVTHETQHSYKIDIPSNAQVLNTYLINIHGWQFIKKDIKFSNASFPKTEKDQKFMSNIYMLYSEALQQKKRKLFWMQELEVSRINAYNQNKGKSSLLGIYRVDLDTKQIDYANWIGDIYFKTMYGQGNFNIPVDIILQGQWIIKLKTN